MTAGPQWRAVATSLHAVPASRDHTVRRDRPLRALHDSAAFPVVSLHAPGGYGKSTLLAQWAGEDSRPIVWLSVRAEAPDPGWLAQTLVDELFKSGCLPSRVELPSDADVVAWHLGVLPALEAGLSAVTTPVLVVIDHAGAMRGNAWDCLARTIACGLPAGSQLALGTRTLLPPSLRRLRASSQVLELGPETLALDALEGAELMDLVGVKVSDADVMSLLETTAGWPVAAYLAGRALASRPSSPIARAAAPGSDLSDFLREEILDRLADDEAQFLLRSSVLPVLDQHMCEAVTGVRAVVPLLRRLAASNRLLIPLDAQQQQFRIHALFGDFLSSEFKAQNPSAWQAAHTAASNACEQVGDLDGAVFHAREADDDVRLGAVAWRYAGPLIGTGRMPVLRRWLDGVSTERLAGNGRLALVSGWLAGQVGDAIALDRFEIAAETHARHDPGIAPDVMLLRAVTAHEGLEEMETLARAYCASAPPDDPWLTLANYLVGVGLMLSDRPEALTEFERGHRLAVLNEQPAMQARHLAAMGELALIRGDTRRAVRLVRDARAVVAAHSLERLVTITPVIVTSARCYVEEGAVREAKVEAASALRLMSLMPVLGPLNEVYNRLSMANVFLRLGDHERAVALVAEAQEAYGPSTASPVGDRAMQDLRRWLRGPAEPVGGSALLTTAEIRILQYLPTHLSFPEIANELFVSRHTVKTQALAAYRKLGVHSRSEAIAKAREAGLLPPS